MSEKVYTQDEIDAAYADARQKGNAVIEAILSGDMETMQEMVVQGMAADEVVFLAVKEGRAPLPTDATPDYMATMADVFEEV